jgi:hypothetical protein
MSMQLMAMTYDIERPTIAPALICLWAVLLVGGAHAQPQLSSRPWSVEKCSHYKAAWSDYLLRTSGRGLSTEFMAAHQAFIDSGCLDGRDVCPRSTDEFAAANAMTIRAMNAGMASTFLPFACPR